MTFRSWLFLTAVALFCFLAVAPSHAGPLDSIRPFIKKHCYECHGPTKQENDRRFDSLGEDLSDVETLKRWQEVVDQLNRGQMPPEDRSQPATEEQARVVEFLSQQLKLAYTKHRSTGGKTVSRRLNRFELRNTIRDLLYLNDPELRIGAVARLVDNNGNGSVENTSTDPFRSFPQDEVEHGFDNIGNRLVMSDFLLKLMFDAAEESLQMATETGPRPNMETRRFAGHVQKQINGDLERLARQRHPEFDSYYRREYITPDELRGGVRTSSRYRIRFEVSGHNQKHPWGETITTDQGEPFRLFLRLAKTRSRSDYIPLQVFELPGNGNKRTIEMESWIDAKWFPQLIWENGPTTREARSDLLLQKYLPDLYRQAPDRKQIPDKTKYDSARKEWSAEMTRLAFENYQGPFIRVHSMTLEPIVESWPPRSHVALFGEGPFKRSQIVPLLTTFAARAYRRPVSVDEIKPFAALVESYLKDDLPSGPQPIKDLKYRAFEGKWTKLPNFDELKPIRSADIANGLIDIRLANRKDYFGIVFEGTLEAPTTGEYEFQMASDDGGRLLIDGQKTIDHDGLHGASLRKAKLKLSQGAHVIRVEYFAYGLPNSFRASWSGPGFRDAPLAVDNLTKKKTVTVDFQTARAIKAMQAGYTAILCSPDFLYLRESGQEKGGKLNQFELASRLSYFLWSSMPDDELFKLAEAGHLSKPEVLNKQVERLLSDPKSAAFTRHFTERWLRLDKLAESPPELNGPFRIYWDRRMEPQIVAQTDRFFADALKHNRSITTLIDSDYTFMNESIADVFYRRRDVKGEAIRKVATNDPRRGGILTQPSVMTATANGVDTSPVVRGVWVLENVLGTPPSPPPPDVEPLSPDLRNAKTIREQLEIHRKQTACASCHRKIDPLGFAFENFDPIGRWRDRYKTGPIDASTTMASGRPVKDIVEFKKLLLDRKEQVARCLAEKLLSYSTGRLLEPTDRGDVDAIVRKSKATDYKLRDLIRLVVNSPIFARK